MKQGTRKLLKEGRKEGREDRKETGIEIKLKYFQYIGEVRPWCFRFNVSHVNY